MNWRRYDSLLKVWHVAPTTAASCHDWTAARPISTLPLRFITVPIKYRFPYSGESELGMRRVGRAVVN
jgi:hypothetical protein